MMSGCSGCGEESNIRKFSQPCFAGNSSSGERKMRKLNEPDLHDKSLYVVFKVMVFPGYPERIRYELAVGRIPAKDLLDAKSTLLPPMSFVAQHNNCYLDAEAVKVGSKIYITGGIECLVATEIDYDHTMPWRAPSRVITFDTDASSHNNSPLLDSDDVPDMPSNEKLCIPLAFDGRLYVFRQDVRHDQHKFIVYDAVLKTWTIPPNPPGIYSKQRGVLSAAVISDSCLLVSTHTGAFTFNLDSNKWQVSDLFAGFPGSVPSTPDTDFCGTPFVIAQSIVVRLTGDCSVLVSSVSRYGQCMYLIKDEKIVDCHHILHRTPGMIDSTPRYADMGGGGYFCSAWTVYKDITDPSYVKLVTYKIRIVSDDKLDVEEISCRSYCFPTPKGLVDIRYTPIGCFLGD